MSGFSYITQTYLNKFSDTIKLIKAPVDRDCRAIIVIPSYNETELEKVLESLGSCATPACVFEVIVVMNCSEGEDVIIDFHLSQISLLSDKYSRAKNLGFHFVNITFIHRKQAGVGTARKIGMDEAVRRFAEINYDGLIVCLDADCTVSHNYLNELSPYAIDPISANSICLNFEHRLENERDRKLKEGIIFYELFLRYYKESLRYCGFPYHFHTIGSSMAVRTSIYCKSGGMNRRKAGEDFYFLHKIFPYGKIVELNSLCVYPSARISDRVPFGTGRAQRNFTEKNDGVYLSYNFKIFEELRGFLDTDIYERPDINFCGDAIRDFLTQNYFFEKVNEIRKNTASREQFFKRFFSWFDGFLVLKYVHFARDNYYSNIELKKAASQLLEKMNIVGVLTDEQTLLKEFRNLQLSFLKNAVESL